MISILTQSGPYVQQNKLNLCNEYQLRDRGKLITVYCVKQNEWRIHFVRNK
jgi:hypothetical protein